MELTTANVDATVLASLFKEGEDTSYPVLVEGIVVKFGFHPERLEAQRENVVSMLNQLSDNFHLHVGGGFSFLNLPFTKDEVQWGEQPDAEQLLALAIGLKLGSYVLPRDLWSALPGGMPYVVFNTKPKAPAAPPV